MSGCLNRDQEDALRGGCTWPWPYARESRLRHAAAIAAGARPPPKVREARRRARALGFVVRP